MRELIDSTEMYLRTVYELGEEGIPPLRARLAERLHLSAPAVSETVARLEQDGLLHLRDDRTLELTDRGLAAAVSVMRKHRLAERLLTDVIGLEWNLVHTEACRWEHVISDEVERRLVDLLHSPTHDAHGNPIPGLAGPTEAPVELVDLATAATGGAEVTIRRISEHLQNDVDTMKLFEAHGVRPGSAARVTRDGDEVIVDADGTPLRLGRRLAQYVYVERAGSA